MNHCEAMRYRIEVLDPPLFSVPGESREMQEIQSWRQRFDSKYAALYFPWVVVFDPLHLGDEPVRTFPPSGHVVGTYANSDLTVESITRSGELRAELDSRTAAPGGQSLSHKDC